MLTACLGSLLSFVQLLFELLFCCAATVSLLLQCRQQLEECFPRLQAALAEHKQQDQQRKSRESATAAADAEQQVSCCHMCSSAFHCALRTAMCCY
jgi:hypothetical protein